MIAHLDLDSFFVSVEFLKAPELKGKAVVVGGHAERGIVTTCSYEARKFGVHSAMPMKKALQLCPHAIILRGNHAEYSAWSKKVTEIIAQQAPLFEKASIDEFYIDLSGMDRYIDPLQWTIALRKLITEQTGLPLSFGIGRNKMIAKMATNEAKPDGFLQVAPGMEKDFLAPLPLKKIPGVGPHMQEILHYHGFLTIRDIQNTSPVVIEKKLGKTGLDLLNKAMGTDISVINGWRQAKSVSKENTFEQDSSDPQFLLAELVRLTENMAFELRKGGASAGCIGIKIRYQNFEMAQRQASIPRTSADDEIIPVVKALFHKLYKPGSKVRLIGVRSSELSKEAVQANLFHDNGKKAGLYKAIDGVKNRFGKYSVSRASGK